MRLLLALGLLFAAALASAQQERPVVYVAPIEGTIDLGLAPYVQRVLDEATAAKADAVVLEINTFGGRVDAAVQIRDALLNSRVRTIAFVNKRAISAGALISLAAADLVMAGGSTIGAATPVQAGQAGEAAKPVGEKTVSYVRKEFRATAESRKRPLLLAEAMVDPDVEIPGVIEKGKLLTLTTDEALEHKLADLRADTLEEALRSLGLGGAELRHASLNWAENVVRFLTHPVVSSLLITIAMIGIIVEIRTPGFGIPGALGIASLACFLWGHWLVQLVGWEEVLLVLAGILLLALEAFVIPGFGIAGVLGILAVIGGLVLSMLGAGDAPRFILLTAARVVFALIFALVGSLLLLRYLPRLPFGRQLVLQAGLHTGSGYVSTPAGDLRWQGRSGRASSALRPAGIADFDGERVDVVSEGGFVDAGEPIEVMRVDGNRIVVKRSINLQEKD
ncbi:MAG: nodulation protein NfeD [Betaproteobacteria bacterium]|nr:nodulation protein NfeD [Betaproteobacteria bacterium]